MNENRNIEANLGEDNYEERIVVEQLREDNPSITLVNGEKVGKIKSYKFNIKVRDKEDLTGEITREEMDLVHRLYSSEGSNLTQRSVSTYFPNYTFQEFKKILRAFGIVKSSSPIAPHIIEEKSREDLIQLTYQNKEKDYLRKLEQDRAKETEVKLKEMTKKYFDLRNQVSDFSEMLSNLKIETPSYKAPNTKLNGKIINVYISDMHIGADVSKYSIYNNTFNLDVAKTRMNKIFTRIIELQQLSGATEINICNLGDSLDGFNAETTRKGHLLPQNMNNKDQYKNYITLMITLFNNLSACEKFGKISYYACEGGNHDGDFSYLANKSLEACLGIMNPSIEVKIFDQFIDYFVSGDQTFVLCHGKDATDMFKNMPLTLNDRTENYINEFIDSRRLSGNIHFIKGDLHQSATTYGKRFRYKSVASFFGSSQWIHLNFGNTLAGIDFDIIDGKNVLETRINLN